MAPAPARPTSAALGTVLAVLFLTFLDTTIVSVTLGSLETDIGAGVIPLQWVINAYALAFASLMLLGGSLGDRFGRRRLMLAGIVAFAVGSLLCALASGVALVIAGRAVMGIGAAASEPGTLSVIRQLYPERGPRARALGAWSAVSGLALALGPVIGGVIVGVSDWRWVFWFNLVAALGVLAAVLAFVPESRDPQPGRLDLAGAALGAAGLGFVIYAAISGEYQGFGTWWIVALFALGGLCLVAFVPVETRARSPLLDLRYVRRPIVSSALFSAFAVYFGVFAIFFFTALYLDIGQHYSGLRLAEMFAPMAAAIVVGGVATGRWVARAGTRAPTVTGCVIAALGMLLARVELGHGNSLTFALLALALALAGVGFGMTVVPLTSAVLTHIPARHSGMAASATNTARQLGAVVGVAALGAIINSHLTRAVSEFFTGPLLGGAKDSVLKALETGGSSDGLDLSNIPDAFVRAFLDGLQLALAVAIVLIVLAGVAAALVKEPAPEPDSDQLTSTGSTSAGSAPPSTESTGSA
ncbi:MAG TPA: MFS transporter [Jatrophihabitans sp.]|jgi:EmrB/QacA subfamily drug resistance transporter|uniref:MFS transporter n=1 Tax=Jatrophihabitans sp. TaxID=1932789 RepID=UPI002DFB041A|nr:MFS transporter [Jatrophihabitans sp.]